MDPVCEWTTSFICFSPLRVWHMLDRLLGWCSQTSCLLSLTFLKGCVMACAEMFTGPFLDTICTLSTTTTKIKKNHGLFFWLWFNLVLHSGICSFFSIVFLFRRVSEAGQIDVLTCMLSLWSTIWSVKSLFIGCISKQGTNKDVCVCVCAKLWLEKKNNLHGNRYYCYIRLKTFQ